MSRKSETRVVEARASRISFGGCFRDLDSPASGQGQSPCNLTTLAQQIVSQSIAACKGSNGYMPVHEQLRHFAGCVYVLADNKVYVPEGKLLNRSRFNVIYGGFMFFLNRNGRATTASAWKAFTQNRVFRAPQCHSLCFRPEQPSGAIIREEGRVLLNMHPAGARAALREQQ